MNPENIFTQISSLLGTEVNNSNILKDEKTNGKKWNYSICATPITLRKPLIIGINWGGGGLKDNYDYSVQGQMPTKNKFLDELKNGEYKFLTMSKDYILEYLKLNINSDNFNYSNLCFFRTPSLKYLKGEDFEISIQIFKKFVNELQPPWILSLGITNIKYLKKFLKPDEISLNEKRIGKSEVIGYTGTLWSKSFYCLPHPNAHIFKIDRDEIWKTVFPLERQNWN
ncbi:MAG: hypothetical protein ABI366_00325 [Ginsengibacter sp.]